MDNKAPNSHLQLLVITENVTCHLPMSDCGRQFVDFGKDSMLNIYCRTLDYNFTNAVKCKVQTANYMFFEEALSFCPPSIREICSPLLNA